MIAAFSPVLFRDTIAFMCLSRHFLPSTQAILSAQHSPQAKDYMLPRDDSIIVISSSPDQSPCSPTMRTAQTEAEACSPLSVTTSSHPCGSHFSLENESSLEILEDKSFTHLLDGYKYSVPRPLSDRGNIPRPLSRMTTQKTNLESFFQETKPTRDDSKIRLKSRVKTSLTTRVAIPPKSLGETVPPRQIHQPSFFTTWAAAQAPMTRPVKASAKPRRKGSRKKKDQSIVLLSPRTGQESIRRDFGEIAQDRRLGEKVVDGLWNAGNRGLEGELYDRDGEIVLSQELREQQSPDISLSNIEIVSMDDEGDEAKLDIISTSEFEPQTSVRDAGPIDLERPAQRKGNVVQVLDNGMPMYSAFTLSQLQVYRPFI